MRSESRIWEIRPFGSMRGGSELVIGLWASQSNRSRLLYYSGLVWITRGLLRIAEISTQEKNMFGVRKGSERLGIAETTEVSNVCEWES